MKGVIGIGKRVARAVVWVAIAALIALGSAGVVASGNPLPGTAARSELTAAGDAAMGSALEAATADLDALSGEVDGLAGTARDALTQVVAGNADGLTPTIGAGTTELARVQQLATRLRGSLAAVPYAGTDWELHVSPGLRARYEQLAGTSELANGLEASWRQFTGRSLDAVRVKSLLTSHDLQTAAAAKLGLQGKYKEALAQLDASDATVAEARTLRDALAKTSDVSTLTAWLDRNADYDAALRTLYAALVKSGARATPEVRKALEREAGARKALPGDTRGLLVIMSDIAQGGLNQAVISIEEVRGSLARALEVQQQLRDSGGTDSASPAPS